MRLVYISSPLRGDMEKNKEKAKDYCAYAASCGVIPLAPHTIFTQYLNDAVPEQREQGLRMGHELLERCDELWVMGDTISQGMKDEIGLATFLQLPILYVSDDMVKNQKMIRQSDRPLDINDCIPESMLMLFTWPILEQFTPEKVKDLISYYRVHKKPMIELANGWYHIEILGGETLQDGDYEPTFEFVIQPATNEEATINADMNFSFEITSSAY